MKAITSVLAIAIIVTLFSGIGFAQINVPTGDSSVTSSVYGGVLSTSRFSVDSLNVNTSATVRVGATLCYRPTEWLSLSGRESFEVDQNSSISRATHFWAKANYGSISLEAGLQASLAAESRPYPTSGDGQFETWTESHIQGAGLGVKAKYNFANEYVGAGVTKRNGKPEYQAKYSSPDFQATAIYSQYDKKPSLALKKVWPSLTDVFVYQPTHLIGNFASLRLSQKYDINAYADYGYSLELKKRVRAEFGLIKNFSTSFVSGLVALGYERETKSVNGYIFVHI